MDALSLILRPEQHPVVLKQPVWADFPDVKSTVFNEFDSSERVDRASFEGVYACDPGSNRPLCVFSLQAGDNRFDLGLSVSLGHWLVLLCISLRCTYQVFFLIVCLSLRLPWAGTPGGERG